MVSSELSISSLARKTVILKYQFYLCMFIDHRLKQGQMLQFWFSSLKVKSEIYMLSSVVKFTCNSMNNN